MRRRDEARLANTQSTSAAALFTSPPPQHQISTVVNTTCFKYYIPHLPCSHMTSESRTIWSDACSAAEGRPLQAQLNATYASCGVTVRCAPVVAAPDVVCAAGSAVPTSV